MYTVPLLCNQLCHTLAALIAVSSMDIALQFLEDIQGNSLSDWSVMDMSSVDQACSESIATYLQSMIDVVEKSDDMSMSLYYYIIFSMYNVIFIRCCYICYTCCS